MKVAYVANRFPRWGGGWVLNEVRGLLGAGIDLEVFSFKPPLADVSGQPGMAAWVQRTTYVPRGSSAACLAAAGRRLVRSPLGFQRGIRTAAALGGRMARGAHMAEVFFLAERIGAAGARHVHAQHADYLADAALAAARSLRLPFSFTGHANDLYTNPGRLKEKIRAARFVATCTGFNESHLRDLCLTERDPLMAPSKIRRVYHGVDLERFAPRASSRSNGPGPARLVTVTRLKEKKGFPWLLEALGRLHAEGRAFHLDIYGEGDQRAVIEETARRLGLAGLVTLHGAIGHDGIPSVLAGADVFVLPCVVLPNQDRDGIPNTIIEALASGLPVVSTAISGIPEAVRDGESGLLVPERDAPALARAIARMIDDPALRGRCSRQGRAVAESLFGIEASGRALADLFRSSGGA
ncbi:MAG TPA: glycosyltransferase family 4 protein [Candidatus Polarisedimenticolia bacterium]|nr:glycosyltransferase family 4 protein [Candidatus Polarisedimenticolia bacterium]